MWPSRFSWRWVIVSSRGSTGIPMWKLFCRSRSKKGEDRNKDQDYRDECERVEVERKFSLGKRKCGMGLVTAKLEETAAHVVALSILLLNLRKIQCAFLQFWDWPLGFLQSREKQMVIQ